MSASARDVAQRCDDDWALITSIVNLAYTHVLRHELDDAERLHDAASHSPMNTATWSRARGTGSEKRATVLRRRCPPGPRIHRSGADCIPSSGRANHRGARQCFLAGLEVMGGDPPAAIARLQPDAPAWSRPVPAGHRDDQPTWRTPAPSARSTRHATRSKRTSRPAWTSALCSATRSSTSRRSCESTGRPSHHKPVRTRRRRSPSASPTCLRSPSPRRSAVAWPPAASNGPRPKACSTMRSTSRRIPILLNLPRTFHALAEVAASLESYQEAARVVGAAQRARVDLGLER